MPDPLGTELVMVLVEACVTTEETAFGPGDPLVGVGIRLGRLFLSIVFRIVSSFSGITRSPLRAPGGESAGDVIAVEAVDVKRDDVELNECGDVEEADDDMLLRFSGVDFGIPNKIGGNEEKSARCWELL
jgi:hypothetical protein